MIGDVVIKASTVSPGYPTLFIDIERGYYSRSEVLALISELASELDNAANESKRLEAVRDGTY